MIINTNAAALNTYNKLNKSDKKLRKSLERLASGKRINKAADDAAGSAISQKMKAQARGTAQAQRNVQDGVSLLQVADEGLDNIMTPPLKTMRDLAVQAANDTYTDADRKAMQDEFDQMKESIDDIANNTEFNTKKLLAPPKVENNNPTTTGKVDIVFFIDNSVSMISSISDVETAINDFVSNIGAGDRVGFVNLANGNVKKLEDDEATIKNNLNSIAEENGIAPYDYLKQAVRGSGNSIANNLGYRSDSKVQFTLFTDTGDEDGSSTQSDATNAISDNNDGYDAGDILTSVFNFGSPTNENNYDNITSKTGGKFYNDLDTPSKIEDNLKKLAGDINSSLKEGENILTLQTGANSNDDFKVELTDARTENLGIADLSIETREDAEKAISIIDKAMSKISSERSKFGAYQNRLKHTSNNLSNYETNIEASNSRIEDVDMAKEMVKMSKQQILSQAGTSMLAQANNLPQGVLQLIS